SIRASCSLARARLAARSGTAAPPAPAVGGGAVLACPRAPSGAGCWRPWTATPAVARMRAAAMAASGLNLASNIIWITPSARAATAIGTAPAAGEHVTNRAECLMNAAGHAGGQLGDVRDGPGLQGHGGPSGRGA